MGEWLRWQAAQQSANAARLDAAQQRVFVGCRVVVDGRVCAYPDGRVLRWQAAQQSADAARLDAAQQAAEVARLTQQRDTVWRVRSPSVPSLLSPLSRLRRQNSCVQ